MHLYWGLRLKVILKHELELVEIVEEVVEVVEVVVVEVVVEIVEIVEVVEIVVCLSLLVMRLQMRSMTQDDGEERPESGASNRWPCV
jgi:hypothetical protein